MQYILTAFQIPDQDFHTFRNAGGEDGGLRAGGGGGGGLCARVVILKDPML